MPCLPVIAFHQEPLHIDENLPSGFFFNNFNFFQLMRILILFLIILFSLITLTSQTYSSAVPIWLTSKFMRAGNEDVIKELTGESIDPIYTFTFSSALPGIPNLAYGIRRYRGADYMGVQQFEIRRINLTASTFTVQVDIIGATNLYIVNVPYIAVDPTFPHHLNSFDNVPISYGTQLTNITNSVNGETSFTNYIKYSQQSAGRTYNRFGTPLSGNKMLLYICALHIWATFRTGNNMYPIDLRISYNIENTTTYKLAATLSTRVRIAKLHFSQIVYNSDDVESSKKYVIVYQLWETPSTGGFLPFPKQFVDNFIMGVTDFSTIDGKCGFEYQWFYQTINGTFGVQIVESKQVSGDCGFQRMTSTVFYMKTWQCPQTNPYFNLTNNLCQDGCALFHYQNKMVNQCDLCGFSCPICLNSTVCLQCDPNHFRKLVTNGSTSGCVCMDGYSQDPVNSTNRVCMTCISNCLACNTTRTCQKCNQTAGYTLSSSLTCIYCGIGCSNCVSTTQGCLTCEVTFWLNPTTKTCECDSAAGYIWASNTTCKLCGIGCTSCNSISEGCLTCKDTYRLDPVTKTCVCDQTAGYIVSTNSTCKLCGIGCANCTSITQGCLTCRATYWLNSTTKKCECDQSLGYIPAQNSTCRLCGIGCANCTSLNQGCLTCKINFRLDPITKTCLCDQTKGFIVAQTNWTCKLCGIGCSNCVSITQECLTCRATYWLNPTTKKCECDQSLGYILVSDSTCKLCGVGCANCISMDQGCLSCKKTYRLNLRTRTCQCDQTAGYILAQNNLTCKLCGIGCNSCVSITQGCLACRETFFLNAKTKKCECPNGTYVNLRTMTCTRCHSVCLTCNGPTQYQCTSCQQGQNRVTLPQANGLVKCLCIPFNYMEPEDGSFVCVRRSEQACDYGYIYIKEERKCVEICGDGKNFGQFQCDDGNRVDGDGCSKTCKVQQGFNCTVIDQTSQCMYVGTVDIVSAVSYKNPYGNHLLIKCELFPIKDFFYNLKWKEGLILIGPNMTVNNAWMESKWLAINTTYFEDLSGKTLTIKYSSALANGKKNSNDTLRRLFSTVFDFDLTLRDYDLPIAPANNLKPTYLEESTYQKVELFQKACFSIAICTVAFISFSMLLKTVLPIWQMVFCLQTLFLSLGSIKSMNPLLSGLTEFSFIKGFRASVITVDGYISQDPNMEYNILILGYGGSLYDNMNIMLMVQLALMLATGTLYLMSKKDLAMNFPFQFAKRQLMLMIFFNCMNFSLSLCLIKSVQPIELTVACAAGLVIIVQVYYFVKNLSTYFYLDQTFNLTRPNLKYAIMLYILLRIVQAVSIAIFRSQTLISASILIGTQAIISLGFSIFRPYKNNLYNILNFLCEWAVTAFLIMNLLLNLDEIELQSTQNAISIAQICLNYLIVLIMVIAFWYSFVMDYCVKKVHSLKIILQKDGFESVRVKDPKSGNKVEVPSLSLHKYSNEFLVQDLESYGSKDTSLGKSSLNQFEYLKKDKPFYR